MKRIYPDVGRCRALIIDSNPILRSMQATMLRGMGVGTVVQTSRVAEARRMLETRVFDIVLCDYHFDHGTVTGQDLLDDLRRAQLLPYSTVFIMVTGEASYARVAEAAESALDSYLLKPHAPLVLEQRLIQARHRKTVLRAIFEAIERDDLDHAAALCRARFDARAAYWLYAARVGAELLIRLGHHAAARSLYEAIQAAKPVPWARLGMARVAVEAGQLDRACQTLATLRSEHPSYADACDLLGRVQVEQGNLDSALETYRSATELTPHSIARLQKLGMLAFWMGQHAESKPTLERSARIGLHSKMFDVQTLVLLALMHFDGRDDKDFKRNHEHLSRALERQPQSVRLQRFVATSAALKALIDGQFDTGLVHVRGLADGIAAEDFDFEAASNLLALLARLPGAGVDLPQSDTWITAVARRFCVSKASTDLLCVAARAHEPHVLLVRAGHVHIGQLAEQAMAHSVKGSHAAAVKSLMARGSETLNTKLVDLAGMVLNRHAAKIDDAAAMAERVDELKRRFCGRSAQVALGGSSTRAAGAITLRT
jgi:CheY-like chemotaxis protein